MSTIERRSRPELWGRKCGGNAVALALGTWTSHNRIGTRRPGLFAFVAALKLVSSLRVTPRHLLAALGDGLSQEPRR